jgi:uncharacterized FlaG/YvyC family protein
MNISSAYTPPAPAPVQASPAPLPQNQSVLTRAVKSLNNAELFGPENEVTFAVDRNARVVVVRVVNKDTREVVEQIPEGIVLQLAEELNIQHEK